MAYCPNCGTPFKAGSKFCGRCGKPLGERGDAAEQPPQNETSRDGQGMSPKPGSPRSAARARRVPRRAALISACLLLVAIVAGGALLVRCGGAGGGTEGTGGPADPTDGNGYTLISDTFDDENYYAEVDDEHYAVDEETGALYVDNELLVYAEDDASLKDVEAAVATVGGRIVGRIDDANLYQVRTEERMDYDEERVMAATLTGQGSIQEAYPHYRLNLNLCAASSNATQDDIWKLPDTSWAYTTVHLTEAWDLLAQNGVARPGSGVTVGILDAGFYQDHPDLKGRFQSVYVTNEGTVSTISPSDDVPERAFHGTAVAGIVGAYEDNGGSVGVAYGSELYAYAFDQSSESECMGKYIYGIKCLVSAGGKGSHTVVNISMGGGASDCYPERDMLFFYEKRKHRYEEAQCLRRGISCLAKDYSFIICTAAGNDNREVKRGVDAVWDSINMLNGAVGPDTDDDGVDLSNRVIVVGGCVEDSSAQGGCRYCEYSCGGKVVDIAAPYKVWGAHITDGGFYDWDYLNGTSFSSPMVAGVAALVWSANPQLTPEEVKRIIVFSSKVSCGYGDGAADVLTNLKRVNGYLVLDAEEAVSVALDWGNHRDSYMRRKMDGADPIHFDDETLPSESAEFILSESGDVPIAYTWSHGIPEGMEIDLGQASADVWYPVFTTTRGDAAVVDAINADVRKQVESVYSMLATWKPYAYVDLYPEVTVLNNQYVAVYYYQIADAGTVGTYYVGGPGVVYRLSDGAVVSPAELLDISDDELIQRGDSAIEASGVRQSVGFEGSLADLLAEPYPEASFVVLDDGVYVFLRGVDLNATSNAYTASRLVGICDLEGSAGQVKGRILDLAYDRDGSRFVNLDRTNDEPNVS